MVVIGAAYLDSFYELSVQQLSGPVTFARRSLTTAGGKGINQALAVKRLGAHPTLIIAIGEDFVSSYVIDYLRTTGLTEDDIVSEQTLSALPSVVVITSDNEVRMLASPMKDKPRLSVETLYQSRDRIVKADVILLTLDYQLTVVESLLYDLLPARTSKDDRPIVVLNPAPEASPSDLPSELLAQVDWLVPNYSEARSLLGSPATEGADATSLAIRLLELGPGNVCITLGESGCIYVQDSDKEPKAQAGFKVDPVDTTGASDAFCGALAVWLGRHMSVELSIRAACAAGALACTVFGASPSMPDQPDLLRLLTAPQHRA